MALTLEPLGSRVQFPNNAGLNTGGFLRNVICIRGFFTYLIKGIKCDLSNELREFYF